MSPTPQSAGLRRRLAALVYDAFLLVAVLFAAAIPATLLNGAAITADGSFLGTIKQLIFIAYLLSIWFLFYGWFWTHGGQTLGMTAWRIQAISVTGAKMNWKAALIRWSCAGLGLANIGVLVTKEKLAWHEQLSGTRTVIKTRT